MTKNEFWNYTDKIVKDDGVYLNYKRANSLKEGLIDVRNLLLLMTNTTDEIRFNKALQTLCDVSVMLNELYTNKLIQRYGDK